MDPHRHVASVDGAGAKGPHSRSIESRSFLLIIAVATLAFAWILWPFLAAIFWAVVIAIVFEPMHARLLRLLAGRGNWAAIVTVLLILLMVVLPLALIAAALAGEATDVYGRIRSGDLDLVQWFQPAVDALPSWGRTALSHFGLTDLASLRDKLTPALASGSQLIATQVLSIGQGTFGVVVSLGVMLYLLFFLVRDGHALAGRVRAAIPLRADRKLTLFDRLVVVIRATVAGDIFVACVQGALGGLGFWFLDVHAALLWGVLMAFLSLLPAIGAALVWLPVAVYFLATGAIWQGVVLVAYGLFVIGLIDNALRPLMVGKATAMPDYVVLLSTLGGIETCGVLGFVVGPVVAAMFMAVWEMVAASPETEGTVSS
ncbi:AI-2E family transporter [Lichenifustis flavocetrariae]|uniref:AI-2E family transporter n=1 Tax=Lichenifustis flavocetrariae TaxID=2949735 RepID=A0AA42CND7_9HYPH|nr:AI-2E family transporter [Lichenifustis flavocetrariae]MCW6512661.1 AI-2E family transporter [Lichenifustis flavocetrariae]